MSLAAAIILGLLGTGVVLAAIAAAVWREWQEEDEEAERRAADQSMWGHDL